MTMLQHLSCEERLELVASHAESLVLITLTPAGNVVDWSSGAQAMFGWTEQEIVGRSITTIFSAEDTANGVPVKELDQAKVQGSAPDTRWLVRKGGSKVFVDGEVTALRLPDGTFVGFAKTLRDATAILHFQQSDATLRAMINATPHMVWSADSEGRADYYNEKMVEFIGQPVESLLGHGWTNFVHPDDRGKAWEEWVSANQAQTPLSIEFRFRHHSGQYHWVLCRGEPVLDQASGELVRWMGTNTDIHEQKVSNDALRDARQRLEATLSAGNIGTWNWDLINDVLYADEHLGRLFGVNVEGGKGISPKPFFAAMHPDDLPCVRGRIQQALVTNGAFSATYRVALPNGDVRYMHARGKVEFADDGTPLWMPGVVVDVTELRASQEELRVREERYRTLFNAVEEGFIIVELIFDENGHAIDHRYVEANTPVSTITGFADLPGKLSSNLAFELSPAWRDMYVRALMTGQSIEGVFEHPRSHRWISYTISRLGDSSMHQVAVFLRDITERKAYEDNLRHREERYRALFNSIEEGFAIVELIFDANGKADDYRFLEVNPALERLTGLKDVLGKRLREVVERPNMDWVMRYADVAHTGLSMQWTDYSEALQAWYDLSVVRVGSEGNNQVALLFKDVTERKRNDAALQQLAEDLAQANRRQRDFLATLAHELRNPLAPIRAGLDALRLVGQDAGKVAKLREVMSRQVSHLAHLVDELLDLARITTGKIDLKLEKVLLGAVVEQAVEAVAPQMDAKHHHFVYAISDKPIWLVADANRLVQIIVNLLTNAGKYTPERGTISLRVDRIDKEAIVTVTDNGIGIATESLPHLFEMFSQVAEASELSEGGLGIGLNLVKRLAEKHGGSVEVLSLGAGKGATFTLRLPISDQIEQDQPSQP